MSWGTMVALHGISRRSESWYTRGWTQMPMVTPKSAAKPKAAPVQSGRIGQYARDLERVAEQVMVPDFGLEQFRRWQRQPEAEFEMLVTQADVIPSP